MKTRTTTMFLALVQAVIGFEWLRAGWEKVSDPQFVSGMGKTLGFFASKNPTGWYKDLITSFAVPNATVFGWLVAYGEFLAGVGLIATAAIIVFKPEARLRTITYVVAAGAFLGAAFMSINFWFAAGWTSVSTDSVNLVMFLIEAVLFGASVYAIVPEAESEYETKFEVRAPRQRYYSHAGV